MFPTRSKRLLVSYLFSIRYSITFYRRSNGLPTLSFRPTRWVASAHTLTAHRCCTTAASSRLQRRCCTPYHSSTLYLRLTEFFSPELMDILRTANALNKWDMTLDTAQYKRMYQRISAIEFSILRIGEYPIPSIIDIVNSIRLAKGNVFAEWKQSDTAKLFEDPGYKNKKQAGGYFFWKNCIFM